LEVVESILSIAVLAGGVLALAALGEVLAERVGVFNLGLEGLMALGGVCGIIAGTIVPNAWLGFALALLIGLVFGAAFAAATVLVRANQVLCGLALTMLGTGLAATVGRPYSGMPARVGFEPVAIPWLSELPIVGPAFFSQNLLVYLIYFIVPTAIWFILFRTRHGLNVRAVGENPAAADAAGIEVTKIRFWYVTIGASLAAGAGAYLTLAFIHSWSDGIVAGRGWIAIALVIFAGYRPFAAMFGALFFGIITALGFVGQARNWPVAPAFLSMLPYLGTLAFMILPVIVWRRTRLLGAAPAALGTPYFRDER
jgi:general nucleoside transport system permease protein